MCLLCWVSISCGKRQQAQERGEFQWDQKLTDTKGNGIQAEVLKGLAKSVDPEMVERAAEKFSSKVGKLRKKSKKDKNNTKDENDKKEST